MASGVRALGDFHLEFGDSVVMIGAHPPIPIGKVQHYFLNPDFHSVHIRSERGMGTQGSLTMRFDLETAGKVNDFVMGMLQYQNAHFEPELRRDLPYYIVKPDDIFKNELDTVTRLEPLSEDALLQRRRTIEFAVRLYQTLSKRWELFQQRVGPSVDILLEKLEEGWPRNQVELEWMLNFFRSIPLPPSNTPLPPDLNESMKGLLQAISDVLKQT